MNRCGWAAEAQPEVPSQEKNQTNCHQVSKMSSRPPPGLRSRSGVPNCNRGNLRRSSFAVTNRVGNSVAGNLEGANKAITNPRQCLDIRRGFGAIVQRDAYPVDRIIQPMVE